jgi:putative nucleotidyltransferase with HDIG domain
MRRCGDKMLRMNINKIKDGSIIAEDIFNNQGVVLLSKGTIFHKEISSKLEDMGIFDLLIEEEENIRLKNVNNKFLDDEDEITKEFKKFIDSGNIDDVIYEKIKKNAQNQVKQALVKLKTKGKINVERIKDVVEEIMNDLLGKKDIVITLSRLRSIDDYTYGHCVSVCILSLLVGIDMGLNKNSLRSLGIGAILHDIGKIVVSEDILKKPSRLSDKEYKEVKKHTNFGYEILKQTDIPEDSARIALNHHEKFDGSGYSDGLKDRETQLLSRIVALTDAYDAMSNDRIYQKKKRPDKIYNEIQSLSGTHFDPYLVSIFLNRVDIYPVGTGVILNTGTKGVVIAQNNFYPEKPVVRLFKRSEKGMKLTYVDINLSKNTLFTILDTF